VKIPLMSCSLSRVRKQTNAVGAAVEHVLVEPITLLRDGCASVQPAVNQRCYGVLNGIIAHNAAFVATAAHLTRVGDLQWSILQTL
jgi:hypothetical protein